MLRRVRTLFSRGNSDPVQAENTSIEQLISSSPEPEPKLVNYNENQRIKKRPREITASDLARALLKEQRAKNEKPKEVKKRAIEDLSGPESPNTEDIVASTPRINRSSRKRFKKYDVTAKRRVINPLLELEEDAPEEDAYNELPPQVVELEEGSRSMKEIDAFLVSDLERQLKSGDNEQEVVETESQVEKISPAEKGLMEDQTSHKRGHEKSTRETRAQKRGKIDIVDLIEVPSWDLESPKIEEVESSSASPAVVDEVVTKEVVEVVASDPSKGQERRESESRIGFAEELADLHRSDAQKEGGLHEGAQSDGIAQTEESLNEKLPNDTQRSLNEKVPNDETARNAGDFQVEKTPRKDGTAQKIGDAQVDITPQKDETAQKVGDAQLDRTPLNDGIAKSLSPKAPSHADSHQKDQSPEGKSASPNISTSELPRVNKALLKERLEKAKNASALTPNKTPKVNKTTFRRRSKSQVGFGHALTQKGPSGGLPQVNKELLKERLRKESEESIKVFGSPNRSELSGVLPKVNRALPQQRLHRTQGAEEDGGSESKVNKALLDQKLRELNNPRELHKDVSGNKSKEANGDSDVALIQEDSGSSHSTPSQGSKADKNLKKNVAKNLGDHKSTSESVLSHDSLNNRLNVLETKASGSKTSKVIPCKSAEVHVKTEVFETPIRPTNRYPIAPALAPGGGFGGLSLMGSSTDPPTSRTTIIPSRTSAIGTGGSLPNLVRHERRPDSKRSSKLFVSQDSPSPDHAHKALFTESSPLQRGLNRNSKGHSLLRSLPHPYERHFTSQTVSLPPSQSRDQLLVPESSMMLAREQLPPESNLAVSSQKSVKSEVTSKQLVEINTTKRLLQAGTLPSSFKPALPDPSKGQKKPIRLNPMYHKVMSPVPAQRKSLAQQLKDRREQLEKSVRAGKA